MVSTLPYPHPFVLATEDGGSIFFLSGGTFLPDSSV